MYVNTPEGFEGAGDVATKFGLDIQDELNMIVNKERFFKETALAAPREGDLIYFPIDRNLFEIKFVEDEKPFYPLGKNTVFELTCEKFIFSEEEFALPEDTATAELFDAYEKAHAIDIELRVAVGGTDYKVDEQVYQGASLLTATAVGTVGGGSATNTGDILKLYNISGEFATGTVLEGVKSTASRNVVDIDDQKMESSEYSDNKIYETDGDNILDFSEIDPWSEGDL